MLEQVSRFVPKKPLCRCRSVWTFDAKVVDHRQRLKFPAADVVLAVVTEGQLSVPPLHTGAGTLEKPSTFLRNHLKMPDLVLVQGGRGAI